MLIFKANVIKIPIPEYQAKNSCTLFGFHFMSGYD